MSAARAIIWLFACLLFVLAGVDVRADSKAIDLRGAIQSCLGEGGTYLGCYQLFADGDEQALSSCCVVGSGRQTPSFMSCEDMCYLDASLASTACVQSSFVDSACMARVDAALAACLLRCDGSALPLADFPPCEELCVDEADAVEAECRMSGGTAADCVLVGDDALATCLADRCVREPTCADQCGEDGAVVYDACMGDPGATHETCLEVARGVVAVCQSNQCSPYVDVPDSNHPDAMARPALPGPMEQVDAADGLPDLVTMRLSSWAPDEGSGDLFQGEYVQYQGGSFGRQDLFFRLDLAFWGVVNPPGPMGAQLYEPTLYGPSPVYGFVEIDMDDDVSTGGEIDAPGFRYLGNVSRFGGLVMREAFQDRVARSYADLDDDPWTSPSVERHGEEFHLALLGSQFGNSDIVRLRGNDNWLFEAGETWRLYGPFFHRAHGYRDFTFMEGPDGDGEYMPTCVLQFEHDADSDMTIVTLLFPLTNAAAANLVDEMPQSENADAWDQTSVSEALWDLRFAALFLRQYGGGFFGEDLIAGWAFREPSAYLDPQRWRPTALLGTASPVADDQGLSMIWSDVCPNVVLGDVDGSGEADDADLAITAAFVDQYDATDGVMDGFVLIPGFPLNFHLYDVDYDGVVSYMERPMAHPRWDSKKAGDLDRDFDIDLEDFAVFQMCYGASPLPLICLAVDYDENQVIDGTDFLGLMDLFAGPDSRFDVMPETP